MKKRLVIAIDPGFDSCKMVVNKMHCKIPFVVQDITEILNSYDLRRKDDSFIRCDFEGRAFIVGEVARTYLLTSGRRTDEKETMKDFYSISRFKSFLFEVGLNAFIGYALSEYEKYTRGCGGEVFLLSELEDWDIVVGLALPHQFLEDLVPVMTKYLIEKNSVFTLTIGNSKPMEIKLPIKECMFNSQTVSALINEVTDDNGQDIDGKSIFDSLPALILDGGYKTFGMFMFERDQSITGAESNQDYAMRNINEAVAERIRKYKPDVYDYMVEELCNKKEVVRYLDNDGKVNTIDVCAIKQEEMTNTIESLVKYILKKYDNLLDVNTILLAGGTGESYYDSIFAYLNEHRDYLADKTSLPKGTFNGEVVPSVYAVVTGLYKDMMGQLLEEE